VSDQNAFPWRRVRRQLRCGGAGGKYNYNVTAACGFLGVRRPIKDDHFAAGTHTRHAAQRGDVEVVPPAAAATATPPEAAFRPVEPKPLGSHHEVDDGSVEVGVGDPCAGVSVVEPLRARRSCRLWSLDSEFRSFRQPVSGS
jgi:hypothetical protein